MMDSSNKPNRSISVKGHFLAIIIILLSLGATAFYFFKLQEDRVNRIQREADEYHLAIANYSLKIKGNLSILENTLLGAILEKGALESEGDISRQLKNDHELSSEINKDFFLINQDLDRILKLQKAYNKSQFEETAQRIKKQVGALQDIWSNSRGNGDPVLRKLKNLQITSTQLFKLHNYAHHDLTHKAAQTRKENQFRFIILVICLLTVGFLVVRKIVAIASESIVEEWNVREELVQAQAVSHTGSWSWDIPADKVYWSDEVFRIFGFQPQQFDVTYETFINTVHPEDRVMVEQAIEKALGGKAEYDIVHRLVQPDGAIRFVREKSLVTFNKEGKAINMIGTVQDITERKSAEDLAVRISRILDESFNEIYAIDEETYKFVQINQSASENMQYTMEEMAAMTPADINPDYTLEQLKAALQPLKNGTESLLVVQTVHQRKDKTVYPVEMRMQLSREETPSRFVGIVQDITERKKAEQAVQEAMQTLETRVQERTADLERITRENKLILHAAGEGIYGVDLRGHTMFLNPAAEHMLGYSAQELAGKSHHGMCHHKRADGSIYPKNECPISKTLQDGLAYKVSDEVFWKKGGTPVPVEYLSTPILDEENVVGAVVTFKDISDRKKAEQDLIVAKEEAERANNAKSEFLSQMSHELRTPLNAILGFGQIMESDKEKVLTEFQKQSVKEILKGGKHLLELINEILDLSRIESGHLILSLENINLNILTEELVTLCDPMAKKSNIELLNFVPLRDDIYVFADRVRLKQVLLNLVSNAVKYNKAGGSVQIDAAGNQEGGIRISVSDTGVGIPADRMEGLFQPFNRLGSERTEIEGTGVGLTITKRLAEHMNGTIEVESQPGVGSTFTVTFPMGEAEEEVQDLTQKEISRKISPSPSRERWVVLYVEDNPANLNLVRHILSRRPDVLLLTAPEAKLGIELAEAHRPDLILLDINLPGMDGLTAFKYLKVMEETRNTPVIAISANAMPSDIKSALEAGFSDYLTKPLDVPEFNRVVEEQLKIGQQRK